MKLSVVLSLSLCSANAFLHHAAFTRPRISLRDADGEIVSPFDDSRQDGEGGTATYTATKPTELTSGPLDLTYENVEMVLDEMRPYLMQDGGNVAITEIDGPVVRLELQVGYR